MQRGLKDSRGMAWIKGNCDVSMQRGLKGCFCSVSGDSRWEVSMQRGLKALNGFICGKDKYPRLNAKRIERLH